MVSCQLKYPVEIVLPWIGALCWWTSCPWCYRNTSGMWRHAFLQLHLKLNQTNYFGKIAWAVKFLSTVFQTVQGVWGSQKDGTAVCFLWNMKKWLLTPHYALFFLKLLEYTTTNFHWGTTKRSAWVGLKLRMLLLWQTFLGTLRILIYSNFIKKSINIPINFLQIKCNVILLFWFQTIEQNWKRCLCNTFRIYDGCHH